MSIEKSLERIADALEIMASNKPAADAVPAAASAAKPAPTPKVAPKAAPAHAQVAQAAPSGALPFNDPASLVKYVTESYQALGPEKGMQIQSILENLGHTNVTEVPADKYGQLHQAIEELKAA